MIPEIKLSISHDDKVIQTVAKEVCKAGFVKSIESFQVIANAIMTQMIEDSGPSTGECLVEEEVDESDSDGEEKANVCVSPKKRKK